MKFRFSETLISWDDSPETKDLLRKAWANSAEDMGLYVKQLAEESLSDENYQAFEFLKIEIEKLLKDIAKNPEIPQEIILDVIKSMVKELKKVYPNQVIAEKLENFLISYENMQENIKN
ncbi:MAG: hypothetical protein OXJ52_10265 [Oligoflexia bacterium]|nr:hypothetical protein [Oligoflexia bacterium]